MFKNYESGKQPYTMTVFAQATWNDDKKCWEVNIVQNETNHRYVDKKFYMSQTTHYVEVVDCDEFVIADALLHANGINVKELYQSNYYPILNSKE